MWSWLKNLFGGKKQEGGTEINTASQPASQAEVKVEETTPASAEAMADKENKTSENSN